MSEGQWVTPREFDAVSKRIDSLDKNVGDISRDVRLLLAVHNREEGAHDERKELLEATKDKGARKLGWAAIIVAAMSGASWVQDALTKLIHHG